MPPIRRRKSAAFEPLEPAPAYNAARDTTPLSGYSREGSVYRDAGPAFSREGSVAFPARDIPHNYARYSSLLDDKHNWGFSTLRRKNSRPSSGFS